MRTMAFGILTVLFSLSAMASETTYNCSARLPKGRAQLSIQEDLGGGHKITLAFKNQAKNQTYIGTLKVASNTADSFLAQGVLLGYEENPAINVSLSGSLVPANDGTIALQLYANGDNRVEYGYGNILDCRKK